MKNTVIFIDAGHGGLDAAGKYTTAPAKMTKHKDGWFYEGVSNRYIAMQLIEKLTEKGFLRVPVFHPCKDTSLSARTAMANYMAETMQVDSIYLSIHSNAASNSHEPQDLARGLTVWTLKDNGKAYEIGKATGDKMREVFEHYKSKRFNMMLQKGFLVLLKTTMPAVLYELGFFDNPHDKALLQNPHFIEELTNTLSNELAKILD